MKKIFKFLLLLAVVVFIGIQLIPVNRTNPPVISDVDAPPAVKEILQRSCYDCHSNETKWPWYSYVAPVSWLVSHDVEEGREELNFSDWQSFAKKKKLRKEIVEEIEEGKMPMPIYLITHRDAKVSKEQLDVIKGWLGISGATSEDGDDD
ncbi:MAG: heme-binding domain-containing protein [Chthoniobacterales bacterium]